MRKEGRCTHSEDFERRLGFITENFALNNFVLLIKSFITTVLKYKPVCILKIILVAMCCYAFLSNESLFT